MCAATETTWPSMGETMLLWNARQVFTWSYVLRKKKDTLFPLYLMFPNIKKVKILTPIISSETMQSNSKCIQQSSPPHFCCFIQLCDQQQKTEWHVLGWKISPVYKKQSQQGTYRIVATSCLQVNLQT